jgi:VWFA-related protein
MLQHSNMTSSVFRAALVLACASYASSQSQVMSLSVVAMDKQGQPVTDLKAEDFQVLDDGKPQPALLFRVNDYRHPVSPAALAPHEYSNRSPETPPVATVILFDLLNGSFTDREYMVGTLTKALSNVESPGNIYLYLLTNNGTLFPIHPLPNSETEPAPDENWTREVKQLLDAAIQKVYGLRPVDDRDVSIRAVTSVNVLHGLGGELAAIAGRKNLVWITNGFPLQINFGGLCHNIVVQNVTAPCTGNFVDFTPVVRHLASQLDATGVSVYPVDEWNVDGGDRMLVKQTLDEFAYMTAGRSYASGGAKNAIPDSLRAMHFNYTIGYQPAPKAWDGKAHKIRVTCSRKGVQVQSEQEYLADKPVDETATLLQVAATDKSDLSQIGLRAAISPGKTPNTIHVQLRMDTSNITLVQQNGHYSGRVAVLYAGLTAEGAKQLAKPESFNLDWTAEQYDKAVKGGIPVGVDLPTAPGVQKLRIVVVDMKANTVGSLTVPIS